MRTSLRRRRGLFAGAVVVALAVAGIAIAGTGTGGTTLVSATFTATTLSHSSTSTCTAGNGDPITRTDATFSGTATSTDPHLNGPVTLHVRSVYDGKTLAGSLTGRRPDRQHLRRLRRQAIFTPRWQAVNVNGNVTGLPQRRLPPGAFTSLAASRAPSRLAGGFTSGAIGAGNPTSAAILVSGGCSHGDAQGQRPRRRQRPGAPPLKASGRSDLTGGREGRFRAPLDL